MSISLIRIDDRMIHGQVVMTWIGYTKSQAIYLIDDVIANDDVQKELILLVAPSNVVVKIFSVDEAIENYDLWKDSNQKTMIIVRTPQVLLELLEAKLKLEAINIGGIGSSPGKKKLYRNISISSQERETLNAILDYGQTLYIQVVPSERRTEVTKEMLSKQ